MEMKRNNYLYKLFVCVPNTLVNFYLLDFKIKVIFQMRTNGKKMCISSHSWCRIDDSL